MRKIPPTTWIYLGQTERQLIFHESYRRRVEKLFLNAKVITIADEINKYFLDETMRSNEISIFLCGGSGALEGKFRKALGTRIEEVSSRYKYLIFYPEDMFVELILGHMKQDLITLENLLANCVNTIVILLQSPGTFTELGAFTNFDRIKDKLVIIIDPKYSKKRSFINLGPLRYLKAKTNSKIIQIPMNEEYMDRLVYRITEASREISEQSPPIMDLSNPIYAHKFYLALAYIFDPIPKKAILEIAERLGGGIETIALTAETVINSLINQRIATFISGNISITSKDVDNLLFKGETTKNLKSLKKYLTELRLKALNLTLRKDHDKIWGEAKGY